MARSIDQITAELNSAYQPQIDVVNKQMAELPAYYQAQQGGLDTAKTNAFGDITNMASSKGMSYSGMPIAEQSRYVGEKYLPAMAQLKQQQTQQQYGLQTNINDIYSKRLTQAQGLQQQELAREEATRQAEAERQQQERQFQQKLAAEARAARSSRGGGGGGDRAPKQPSVDDAAALVNSLRSSGQYGDSQYGSIAEAMRQRGYDISRDSVYDKGLRKAFNFGYS
ncbi:hypothetical protein H0W80_00065 [Candidatus Saccharibacteria bacterium]|nr:hypothetical protein [Candidatus Saccharibacteria bacterium]